jgi:hypothetical protein
MRRFTLAAALVVAALLAVAGVAAANEPQSPCANGNPTDLCDGHITVTVEPAGPNCQFGGIKVVVQHGRLDGSAPPALQEGNGPPPDPPDSTTFVCNGGPGPAGPTGPPGPPGPPGATTIVTPPVAKRCGPSVRLRVRFLLPARFDGRRVQLTIQGPSTTAVRFRGSVPVLTPRFGQGTQRFIYVPLRNRNCGVYLLRLHQDGAGPDLLGAWTITGLFGLNRQRIQ